jgi:hypothetical protein
MTNKHTPELEFQLIDSLASVLGVLIATATDATREQRDAFLEERIQNLSVKGIVPGRGYNDYPQRFQFMLDTITVMGELGKLLQAVDLANKVLPLAEIAGPNTTDPQLVCMQWLLRSNVLWTLANVFNQNELFVQSLDCLDEALAVVFHMGQMTNEIREQAASRYLSLVDSATDPDKNLQLAEELLASQAKTNQLSPDGLLMYFKILRLQERFSEASECAEHIRNLYQNGKYIFTKDLNELLPDFAAVALLAKLKTPKDLLLEFGPFAWPVYAECKKLYLSEAWSELYDEALPDLSEMMNDSFPTIFNGVVLYQNGSYIPSEEELLSYQNIHSRVRARKVQYSEGSQQQSFRAIPTALVYSYMRQIAKSADAQFALPKGLEFFLNWGRNAYFKEGENSHKYVSQMLEFFALYHQETNAVYQCAAILSGLLLEAIGPANSPEISSYLAHLEVTDHSTALLKGKKRIQLQLLDP